MLKGVFTLVKYKAILDENGEWVPGDIVDVIEQQNNIQYKYHDKHMRDESFTNATTIMSTESLHTTVAFVSPIVTSNILNTTVDSGWVRGARQGGPTWVGANLSTNPPINGFWTTQTRFTVPASTRYIRSVALGRWGNGGLGAPWFRSGMLACVSLEAPCLQQPDELLDVFYRIFVDVGPGAAGKVDASLTMMNTFGFEATIFNSTSTGAPSTVFSYYPSNLYCEQTKVDENIGRFNVPSLYNGGTIRDSNFSSHINMLFGHRFSVGIPASIANVQPYHGLLFRAFSVKRGQNNFITSQPVSKGSGSAVQNTFHRQIDTGNFRRPFLDIDNQGNSLAKVIMTDPGTWADAVNKEPFVHHYRVEITEGGLVGTAEYKIRRRRCTGWNYAMYQPMPCTINTMSTPGFGTHLGRVGTDGIRFGQGIRRVQQYVWPEFLNHSANGITVMNVNGEFENIGPTTFLPNTPIPLPTSSIMQVGTAYDTGERTGDLFVACENTGLWKVERPSLGPVSAITKIEPAGITSPNSCRGVTVNRVTGDVWAIFHDTVDSVCYLAKSTDQGATWTLYDETTDPQFLLTNYTSGTPGPSNILGLHVNPYSANGQLMIVAPDAIDVLTDNNQAFWWSETGASPTSNQVRINMTRETAGHLKYRNYMHNAATPLNDTQWFVSGPFAGGTSQFVFDTSQYYGNGRIAFGGATANATNVTTNSSIRRNHIGIVGNLTYYDEFTDITYMLGTGEGAGPTTFSGAAGSTSALVQPLDLRTSAQYNTDGTRIYTNTAGVNTTTNSSRVARLDGHHIIHSTMQIHIGNGIFLCGGSNSQCHYFLTFYGDATVATENAIPWFEQWGWNGSEWERGHADAKVTHAGDEDVLDTLQLRFDDNGGTDPLVVGEYYDIYVYDGILLDDATAFAQTVFNYMHATDAGTDFTPGTVPASNLGARGAEPLAMAFPGWTSAENGLTTPAAWSEPGKIIPGRGLTDTIYMENKLEGDFEFRFKMTQDGSGYIPRLGLVNWSAIEATPRALTTTNAGHRFHIRYNRNSVNNVTEELNYTITIHSGNLTAGTSATVNVPAGAEDDMFAFRRVGSTITFLINDAVVYTFPTATAQDLGIAMWHNMTSTDGFMGGWTLYDGEIDYTVNRRYVEVGNGVDTGAKDINFDRLISHRVLYLDINVALDGTPAVLLNDGVTPPGPGEVQILPCSGRLWFHEDDAGKAITGNWRILKNLNLK
jgi:hypothetical protein